MNVFFPTTSPRSWTTDALSDHSWGRRPPPSVVSSTYTGTCSTFSAPSRPPAATTGFRAHLQPAALSCASKRWSPVKCNGACISAFRNAVERVRHRRFASWSCRPVGWSTRPPRTYRARWRVRLETTGVRPDRRRAVHGRPAATNERSGGVVQGEVPNADVAVGVVEDDVAADRARRGIRAHRGGRAGIIRLGARARRHRTWRRRRRERASGGPAATRDPPTRGRGGSLLLASPTPEVDWDDATPALRAGSEQTVVQHEGGSGGETRVARGRTAARGLAARNGPVVRVDARGRERTEKRASSSTPRASARRRARPRFRHADVGLTRLAAPNAPSSSRSRARELPARLRPYRRWRLAAVARRQLVGS